jgi:hypothetical protein
MTFYAIAVDTSPLDYSGLDYKTRYWGAGFATYLWHSRSAAEHYLSDLDGPYFTGKGRYPHVVDDAYVVEVTDKREVAPNGEVMFPWFSSPMYDNEGYDTPPIYAEQEQSNA